MAMVVADVNGDGSADLVVANGGDGTVSVLLGRSDGSFGASLVTHVGGQPGAVATGDFDGDGLVDLALTDEEDSVVTVASGLGDGRFGATATYPNDSLGLSIATAPLASGRRPSIVVGNVDA